MLVGGDATDAWELHQALIAPLRWAGLDEDELRSEFEASYRLLKGAYPWSDQERLRRWMNALLVRFWLSPHVIVGREAAMRVYGRRSLSGDVARDAEARYDSFYPVYDPALELHQAAERPGELRAMEWRLTGSEGDAWRRGVAAEDWAHYPESVGGRSLIGERTCYVRPEWEWPRERRYRGLVAGSVEGTDERTLRSAVDLTYELYVNGDGQEDGQLVVLNNERQLGGLGCRWAAINANFARALGWRAATDVPFRWVDGEGRIMVESICWRDGWTQIEPPRFESLGEGWLVCASAGAIEAIRREAPLAERHLWVERRSYGDRPCRGEWHLSQRL